MQRRWKLSSAQRARHMWSRWKVGQSLNAIGRALGKDKQVIHFLLACHGDQPAGPSPAASAAMAERRHLPWDGQWLLDAGHRSTSG